MKVCAKNKLIECIELLHGLKFGTKVNHGECMIFFFSTKNSTIKNL